MTCPNFAVDNESLAESAFNITNDSTSSSGGVFRLTMRVVVIDSYCVAPPPSSSPVIIFSSFPPGFYSVQWSGNYYGNNWNRYQMGFPGICFLYFTHITLSVYNMCWCQRIDSFVWEENGGRKQLKVSRGGCIFFFFFSTLPGRFNTNSTGLHASWMAQKWSVD